ncbi:hypothetical protein J7363_10470 [Phaeobacter italicus]|uniref:hypothetical protein n=1 Tax=Phaeobacter italicus TaxID=481446 RepID=UPI001AD9BC11|nr:hypothetical protein [Phaeobacter italicus]MBO9442521.1 hypothetical protein [Phaeobacter italicus]
MRKVFITTFMFCVLGTTATAACHDFLEDNQSLGPEVIICYGSKCDLTRVAVQCNGGGNNFTDYEVGWRFGYTYEVDSFEDTMQEYILWKGAFIPTEKWEEIRVFELHGETAFEVN